MQVHSHKRYFTLKRHMLQIMMLVSAGKKHSFIKTPNVIG